MDLSQLAPDVRAALLAGVRRKIAENRLHDYKPYPKQQEFHTAGATFRERLLMAPNQSGKTLCAAAEVAIHLTGRYPDWWAGKRYSAETHWLAGSESGELTRRGVQRLLLGRDIETELGTGYIPRDAIISAAHARGVPGLVDTISVRHASGGISTCGLKSYDQGRGKWQAETCHGVWFDEEPPEDVYFEGITRTNITQGPVMLTFTPLKGVSSVVRRYLIDKSPGTTIVTMALDDAPHYTAEQRAIIIASYPEHEREARAYGRPTMGSGLVFKIPESSITEQSIQIPPHWPRIVGMDFGWDHPTAAVWIAWDRDTDCVHVYDEYRQLEAIPAIHAATMRAKGDWIPVSWPHDGLQHDKGSGEQIAEQYRKLGVKMLPERATFLDGTNGVEAGVMDMLDRMSTGRLKVAAHLSGWLEEVRMYHRKDGKIVKKGDDLLSATRYGIMMLRHASVKSSPRNNTPQYRPADSVSGY